MILPEDELTEKIREQAKKEERERILKIIEEYILTDAQGKPLSQCQILWKLKERIKCQN